jgi:hypothetical protein
MTTDYVTNPGAFAANALALVGAALTACQAGSSSVRTGPGLCSVGLPLR